MFSAAAFARALTQYGRSGCALFLGGSFARLMGYSTALLGQPTIGIASASLALAMVLGVPLALIMVRGGPVGRAVASLATLVRAVPELVLAIVAVILFLRSNEARLEREAERAMPGPLDHYR